MTTFGRATPRIRTRPWLATETRRRAGRRSLFLRHIDGGSSNIFEAELAALTGPVYDLQQYGIRFVSSPAHADVLLLTGPLSRNMLPPLRAAFEVMPEPKAIVTVGDYADFDHRCEIDDPITRQLAEILADSYATADLPDELRRAIVAHIPGDPPEPHQIIEVLLSVDLRAIRRQRRREPSNVSNASTA